MPIIPDHDARSVTLELPYPPSVNHYWRNNRGRFFIASEGVLFRSLVKAEVIGVGSPKLFGPIAVSGTIHPPDRRRRDLDNVLKALFDALAHAGVMDDDSQIREYRKLGFGDIRKGGLTVVMLEMID